MPYGISLEPPDPPLCHCGEVAPELGEICEGCGDRMPDAEEIEERKAEAAIARAEDDRMFGEEPW